jgi:hypothetical protein
MELTKEQFEVWRVHPITEEVFREVGNIRDGLKESLAEGRFLDVDSPHKTAMRTAEIVGHISGLDELLNISFAEEGEESD